MIKLMFILSIIIACAGCADADGPRKIASKIVIERFVNSSKENREWFLRASENPDSRPLVLLAIIYYNDHSTSDLESWISTNKLDQDHEFFRKAMINYDILRSGGKATNFLAWKE